MKHIPLKPISIKNHPQLNERWLQAVIESDPGILGLGDVVVKDRERKWPTTGETAPNHRKSALNSFFLRVLRVLDPASAGGRLNPT